MSQVEIDLLASDTPMMVRSGRLNDERSFALSDANSLIGAVLEDRGALLEAALKSSRFLIRLSHEMRTPLNSILGVAQMMLETGLTAAEKDFAETVAESAQALASIAEAIANFSGHLESQQAGFQESPGGLSENESAGSLAPSSNGDDLRAVALPAGPSSQRAGDVAAKNYGDGNRLFQKKTRSFSTRVPPATAKLVRILVAEDHPLNQRVMLRMLARLGYAADAVSNGNEAVAALARNPYDIVLMDCQMPELDGYEATRQIRSGGGRFQTTPIIAVTANAMDGDREKCFASGMSDYISKPVLAHALATTLEKWILPAPDPTDAAPAVEQPGIVRIVPESQSASAAVSKAAPVDLGNAIDPTSIANLRAMDAGDEGFLTGIIQLFLADLVERLAALKVAAATRDGAALKSIAHALKGSCGHFGAARLTELCRKMGQIAAQQPVGEANETFLELEAEAARVRSALEEAKLSHSQIQDNGGTG
jgi:CheY-like chemotaxis protein